MTSEQGIVEIVIETPCFACQRLARYTVYHRANDAILARLAQPLSHSDVHEIVYDLEHMHAQVPVGLCECGANGQETTSVEFADRATHEDLNYVADDLAYEVRRLSLDGKTLWESDGELRKRIIETPDPTPDDAIARSRERQKAQQEVQAHLAEWLERAEDAEPPAASYIRAKAELFCRIGADTYRTQDAFHEPSSRLDADDLAAVCQGMQQIVDGLGFAPDVPLEGIPAESSHALVRTLHFQVVAQHARRSADGLFFLDALLCRHVVDGRELTIYNRVPTQKLINMLSNAAPVDEVSAEDLLSGRKPWF